MAQSKTRAVRDLVGCVDSGLEEKAGKGGRKRAGSKQEAGRKQAGSR